MLDAGSLAVLGAHFERLMVRIQERVDYVGFYFPLSTRPERLGIKSTRFALGRPHQRAEGSLISQWPILMVSYVLAVSPNYPFNHGSVP